jgi:hypothetical protein
VNTFVLAIKWERSERMKEQEGGKRKDKGEMSRRENTLLFWQQR